MRAALHRVLEKDWIVVLAAGISLGYTALNLAESIGSAAVTALGSQTSDQLFAADQGPLTFTVGDHAILLGPIVQSAIALVVVFGVVAFAVGRFPPRLPSPPE